MKRKNNWSGWLPRALGAMLALLAVLAYLGSGVDFQSLSLGIAGIVLLVASQRLVDTALDRFKDSWHLGSPYAFMVIFDAAFWASAYFFKQLIQFLSQSQLLRMEGVRFGAQALANLATVTNNVTLVRQMFIAQGALAFAFFAGLAALYGISRGMIWLTIARTRITGKALWKYVVLTAVWWLLWLIPAVFLLFGVSQSVQIYAFIALLFPYAHLTGIVYAAYARNMRIGRSIASGFSVGIAGLWHFIVGYSLAYVPFFVLSLLIATALGFTGRLSAQYFLFAELLLAILYLGWFRPFQASTAAAAAQALGAQWPPVDKKR